MGETVPRGDLYELAALRTNYETELLLACLRWPISAEVQARIVALAEADINWTVFSSLVARHRVFGLAEHGLRLAGVKVPHPQCVLLRDSAKRTSWSELILAGELRTIQEDFHAAGIKPTILKGVPLSVKAYGRLGMRYNRDIDILLPWANVAPACDILQSRGYARIEPPADASASDVKRWIWRQKDIVYQHSGKDLVVEIHWRLFDNPHLLRLEDDGRRDTVVISGDFTAETLPADLDLIFNCAHGAHHAWSRLKWIADVNAIFAKMPQRDVLRVYRLARTLNVHRMVAQALILCSRLLGLVIPKEVIADSRADWRIRSLTRIAFHVIFSRGAMEIEDSVLGSTPKNIAHYLLSDGARYYLSEMLFDLTDLSGTRVRGAPLVLVPFLRVSLWFVRCVKMSLQVVKKMKQ